MADIQYGKGAYSRARGNLPDLPLINMFVESSPTQGGGVTLQSRKGLEEIASLGNGPVRGVFQRDGALGGVRFVVSGNQVYAGSTLLGTIEGSGPVSMAASETEMVITAGGPIYRTNGATLTQPVFPDGAYVTAVCFLAGYFLGIRAGTQQFYWSDVLDATTWDGLSFASAENEPDHLRDCIVVDDMLVLLGSETVEFWPKTGDADIPFAPIAGRVFEQGVIATGCAVSTDNSFFWVGNDKIVYRNGNTPEAISDDGIVERAATSATFAMFLIEDERHKFLCCRFDGCTMAYDITTGQWCEFASWGLGNFRVQCAISGPVMGSAIDGRLYRFSGYQDAGGVLERRWRGGFPLTGGSAQINNVRATCNSGQTPFLTGPYTDPQIEMRLSNDYAQTWTDWEGGSLGEQGNYRALPEWRALGIADAPGVLFEWRVTDPVPVRFSGAQINERGGGRQR